MSQSVFYTKLCSLTLCDGFIFFPSPSFDILFLLSSSIGRFFHFFPFSKRILKLSVRMEVYALQNVTHRIWVRECKIVAYCGFQVYPWFEIRSKEIVVFSTSEYYKQNKYRIERKWNEKKKMERKKQNHEVERWPGCVNCKANGKCEKKKTFELDFYENPKTTRSMDTIEVKTFSKPWLLNISNLNRHNNQWKKMNMHHLCVCSFYCELCTLQMAKW